MRRALVNILALLTAACSSWLIYSLIYPDRTLDEVPWYLVPILVVDRLGHVAVVCGCVALAFQRLAKRRRAPGGG